MVANAIQKSKHEIQSSQNGSNKENIANRCSFKKMQFGSIQPAHGDGCGASGTVNSPTGNNPVVNNQSHSKSQKRLRNTKKISILVMQEQVTPVSFPDSENLITISSIRTLRQLLIPRLDFNLQTITKIYDSPSPFLINLSLCLFLRYLVRTSSLPALSECSWILCIATMISYKLYYDEELQGVLECFKGIIGVEKQDIIDLQRCFLARIEYQTVVRGGMYHYVMSLLMKESGKPESSTNDE